MRCIYLIEGDVCKAHPLGDAYDYKPEAETISAYCKHPHDMRSCPRLVTYQNHLASEHKK